MTIKKRISILIITSSIIGILGISPANAISANNGAGGTFTYSSGATYQQMMLAACESWAGVGKCNTDNCGYFSYYYKTTDGSCICNKAIGTYEFVYNNTGYTDVGSDYTSIASVNITTSLPFVRKKNGAVCNTANVWLLSLANVGTPLNVTSTLSSPSVAGNPTKGVFLILSATANNAGTVSFYSNGHLIAGCKNRPTDGSFKATCNWRPITHGAQNVTAYFTPTDGSYTLVSATNNLVTTKRQVSR